MIMKTRILTLTIFIFSIMTINAQDIITKKDGVKLKVIIKKVTKNNIKYVNFDDPNGVQFTIDKVLIKEVIFAYGKDLDISNPEKNTLYFSEDRINNIMLNFSAITGNTLAVAYERALRPGQSLMGEFKIYGLGSKPYSEESRNGFGIDLHYRLKTQSLFNKDKYRPKHILHGTYFAPMIGFSSGTINTKILFSNSSESIDHSIFHLGIQYGKQWIIQRSISVDTSFGFHYFIGSTSSKNDYEPVRLGNMMGNNNKLFSINLRVGFLTGKKGYDIKKKSISNLP